jgi:hypothetical protein
MRGFRFVGGKNYKNAARDAHTCTFAVLNSCMLSLSVGYMAAYTTCSMSQFFRAISSIRLLNLCWNHHLGNAGVDDFLCALNAGEKRAEYCSACGWKSSRKLIQIGTGAFGT